ncbi:MAG TPA: hypothetical protein VGH19_04830 [Verrucomicrobiae bacterium]
MNRIWTVVVSSLLLLQGACKPSAPAPQAETEAEKPVAHSPANVTVAAPAAPPALLSWHSAGLKSVAEAEGGSRLREVLGMPQTAALKSNTLVKLSHNLPAIIFSEVLASKAQADKLKPLLDDIATYESKVVWASEAPLRWRVSVKIPVERTGIWSANLHALLASGQPAETVPLTNITDQWFTVSYTPQETYSYGLKEGWVTVERSEKDYKWGAFSASLASNVWLAVELPARILPLTGTLLDTNNLPYLRLTMEGKGENQLSRLDLKFLKDLKIPQQPWNVPTNTIKDPIVSFTALRGVGDIWSRVEALKPLGLPKPPEQIYVWAQTDLPFQTFVAASVPGASNLVQTSLKSWTNELQKTYGNRIAGRFASKTNELNWAGLMGLLPFLKAAPEPTDDYLVFGLAPMVPKPQDLPRELLMQFIHRTNLVYYDWEITEARLTHWLQSASLLYMAANRVPIHNGVAPYQWAVNVASKLGNTVTEAELAAANEIKVFRKSPAGMSGFEIYLFFRWLDQKSFPRWDEEGAHQLGLPELPASPGGPGVPK